VGWLAVDHFYPEWDIWSKFTSESLQSALTMDSLKGSHAIEVQVNDALEIDQIFDAISYMKGSSCIRMLSKHLGVKTFLKVHALGLLIIGSQRLFEETRIWECDDRGPLECLERCFRCPCER
jgi:hypothetical protein